MATDGKHPRFPTQHGARLTYRRDLRRLCAVAAFLLFSHGCKVGPEPVAPAPPPIDDAYLAEPPANSPEVPDLSWWMRFDDPVLSDLIRISMENNYDLELAAWRVLESRAQQRVVRGGLFPQMNGDGSYGFRRTSGNANQFVPSESLLKGFDFYSAGIDASWEIDLFGKLRRALEASRFDLRASKAEYGSIMITMLGDVAANYVNVRVMQERIRLAEENLRLQQQTLSVVRQRLQAGLAEPLDEAQSATIVHNTSALIPPLREELRIAQNRLAILLGITPAAVRRMCGDPRPIPDPPELPHVGVPADLLRRRPDVVRREAEVLAAAARIGVATADLYPQLTLVGTISADTRLASSWFEPASIAHNVGPQFSWQLLNFGRVRGRIDVQEARFRQAVAAYRASVLTAVVDVENSLVGFVSERQRADQLRRSVRTATDAVRLSQTQYERGLATFVNVLDAQRQRLVSQDAFARSRGRVVLNMIRLYKAIGGGWSESLLRTPLPCWLPDSQPNALEVVEPAPIEERAEGNGGSS